MTKGDCAGCRDDFYNDHNPMGVKECWMFKTATLVARYRTHRDAMPASKGAFTRRVVPSCYNQAAIYYVKDVPSFVKAADVTGEAMGQWERLRKLEGARAELARLEREADQ